MMGEQEVGSRMSALTIEVSELMREWIDSRVLSREFKTPDEYLLRLLEEDRKRCAEERLEQLLLDGLDSGPPVEVNQAFWQALKERVQMRLSSGQVG